MIKHPQNIRFLKRAIELAKSVKGSTSPNPAVGAVLVKNNHIISEGATQKPGSDHAEVVAIKNAKGQSYGSTLYVTLEPCCTYGRTPPCTNLIIEKGIQQVIIGVLDPNPKVNGRGIEVLINSGIKVEYGFFEDEINTINEDFNKYITKNIPYGIAKYAMTLDGKIATGKGDSKWISSEQSRNIVHHLRNQVDAVLVGVNTVICDNPELNVRLENKHKDPIRVIIDSQGRTPFHSKVFQDKNKTIFVLKKTALNENHRIRFINECQNNGKQIIYDDSDGDKISLKKVFQELVKLDIISVLIEGGGDILSSSLQEHLVDKIICFIAPKIVLGKQGIFPFGGTGYEKIEDAIPVNKLTFKQVENDIMVTGYVNYDLN